VQATYYNCVRSEHQFMKYMRPGMGETKNNTQANFGYCFS